MENDEKTQEIKSETETKPEPAAEPECTDTAVAAAADMQQPTDEANTNTNSNLNEAAPSETTVPTAEESGKTDSPDTAVLIPPEASVSAEPETASNAETAKKSNGGSALFRFLCDAGDLLESVITAIFAVMLIFTFLVCTASVEGDSMVPTLDNGDRLLVSRMTKHYQNGDILILNTESAYLFDEDGNLNAAPGLGKTIVKRLTAQSGQEVNIDFDEGIVYVDGAALDEPYTNTLTKRDNRAFSYPLTVPEGYVFVLGDNRHISKDSRHPEVGLIPEECIIGKVLLRITPLSKFGTINSTGSQQTESQRD